MRSVVSHTGFEAVLQKENSLDKIRLKDEKRRMMTSQAPFTWRQVEAEMIFRCVRGICGMHSVVSHTDLDAWLLLEVDS